MGDSGTATPTVKCSACGQSVRTFDQWFEEWCSARTNKPPEKGGHQITWAERATLPANEGATDPADGGGT